MRLLVAVKSSTIDIEVRVGNDVDAIICSHSFCHVGLVAQAQVAEAGWLCEVAQAEGRGGREHLLLGGCHLSQVREELQRGGRRRTVSLDAAHIKGTRRVGLVQRFMSRTGFEPTYDVNSQM